MVTFVVMVIAVQTEVELYMEVAGAPELDLLKHDVFFRDLKLASALQQLEWTRRDIQVCAWAICRTGKERHWSPC